MRTNSNHLMYIAFCFDAKELIVRSLVFFFSFFPLYIYNMYTEKKKKETNEKKKRWHKKREKKKVAAVSSSTYEEIWMSQQVKHANARTYCAIIGKKCMKN